MNTSMAKAFARLQGVADPSEAEGLTKPRSILLLWFLRNGLGLDDIDAYDHVCDGDDDQGIDGIYVETRETDLATSPLRTIVLFQSRYPMSAKNVGVKDIREFIGAAQNFQSTQSVNKLLSETLQPELRVLIRRYGLPELFNKGARVRLTFVTAGVLTRQARALIASVNAEKGYEHIRAHDLLDLDGLVLAATSPATVNETVVVEAPSSERFVTTFDGLTIAVCAVAATAIAGWPGIASRLLFDVNVRGQLRPNRVRQGLDRAIRTPADHRNFVAYHNGITVICGDIDASSPSALTIENIAVVNGTQSVIAFYDNRSDLTSALKVVVKFIALSPESLIARQVAIRSNTQTPVNDRNLRALDGHQLRLVKEFEEEFPGVAYETRPEYTAKSTGKVIPNDKAAQLLCALYSQKPWLAVKRLQLFSSDVYPTVFTPETMAAHVVVADLVRSRVELAKSSFPLEYRSAWRLTALVAVFLVGQLLRADDALASILCEPRAALKNPTTTESIDRLIRHAVGDLKVRHESFVAEERYDDFKVDFKNETKLRELAQAARVRYIYYQTVGN